MTVNPARLAPYQEWQIGQEWNLAYVAATRAQEALIEVAGRPEEARKG